MNFVLDTNVLIHAIDGDLSKAPIAQALLVRASERESIVPRQVLGELLNVGHKRGRPMLGHAQTVARLLEATAVIVDTDRAAMQSATELAERYRLQFFDALICTIARMNAASVLFTEDMHDGLRLGGLTIVNPFDSANAQLVSEAISD